MSIDQPRKSRKRQRHLFSHSLVGAACVAVIPTVTHAGGIVGGPHYQFSGYVRENISIGFENHPERSAATGKRFGGAGDILMQRHSMLLEGAVDFGWAYFGAVGRFSRVKPR